MVLGVKHIIILLLAFPALGVSAVERPNILIILTDDQGTIDANCYGSTDLRTPNIDRLAATGVRFTQAYAHTVCCPARAALMTGRHPQRGGVHHWTQGDLNGPDGINMALGEVTLAEALKPAGYRTALYGKWHLGAHRDFGPKKQGFDEFFGIRDGFIDNYNHYFLHGSGFHDLYDGIKPVKAPGKYFPELMVQRSLKFIMQNKDRPFLLYVPFNIPHYPEQALKRFEAVYKDIADPARRSYAAIVSTTDHYIGKIVDKLEALDLRENTIIIFMSDNGHSTEEGARIRANHKSGMKEGHYYHAHGGGGNTGKWRGSKGSYYEGGLRVPAIISYPARLPEGEVRGQAITAADWFPTILDLCGIERPKAQLDGHSVLPLIQKPDSPSLHRTLHWGWGNGWAVRKGDWKLIGNGNQPRFLGSLAGEHPEASNHLKEKPKLVQQLLQLHQDWVEETRPR